MSADVLGLKDALDNQNAQQKENTERDGRVFERIDKDEDFANEVPSPEFRMAHTTVVIEDLQFKGEQKMTVDQKEDRRHDK